MAQEEKSKAYNELVGKIKKAYLHAQTDSTKAVLEDILPGLKESEDERIRKWCISHFKACINVIKDNDEYKEYLSNKVISWLEKQGKQKPADNNEPKFHEGDWIISNDKKSTYQVIEVKRGIYVIRDNADNHEYYIGIEACERSGRLWNISDAKPGDVLFHSDSASNGIFIFKELSKRGFSEKVICYCDYDSEDHFCLGENHSCCWTDAKILHPATKEQRDLLFKKMHEAGYEWDDDNKELKKIEQKPADKDEPKEDNRSVTERIKTFDDALQELSTKAFSGDETAAILLADYESNANNIMHPQILAYMRLAIIAYALNEGWKPQFTTDEYRYFPWFHLYTKEEYDELDDEKKGRCVLCSGGASSIFGFVVCAAGDDASYSYAAYGSRLVFRTRELAAYAGRQFIEEWADFVFKTE